MATIEKGVMYEFHKRKKQLLILDKIIIILIIISLGIFNPDYVMITVYLLLIPYLIITQRIILFYHLIVSSAVAIIWMLIAKNQYGYNRDFLTIFGINLYPLFCWAAGLLIVYIIYSHYEHILKEQGYLKQLTLFIAFYWPLLIAAETIAYHVFNIHNLTNASYAGLPICDCIHAPRWTQIAYFAIGPIFFTICSILKLENPHVKIRRKIKKFNQKSSR